ncbi:MAG: response regulator [Bacteroidota bacterium]
MKKKRVLIIDDDARNIFALSATLRAKGFDCVSSNDAREAVKLLERDDTIDIVLTDMMMPEMDGYETIEAIRANEKTRALPVIAVTAQAMPGDRERCISAGATEYISKPIDVDRLLQLLGNYLPL